LFIFIFLKIKIIHLYKKKTERKQIIKTNYIKYIRRKKKDDEINSRHTRPKTQALTLRIVSLTLRDTQVFLETPSCLTGNPCFAYYLDTCLFLIVCLLYPPLWASYGEYDRYECRIDSGARTTGCLPAHAGFLLGVCNYPRCEWWVATALKIVECESSGKKFHSFSSLLFTFATLIISSYILILQWGLYYIYYIYTIQLLLQLLGILLYYCITTITTTTTKFCFIKNHMWIE